METADGEMRQELSVTDCSDDGKKEGIIAFTVNNKPVLLIRLRIASLYKKIGTWRYIMIHYIAVQKSEGQKLLVILATFYSFVVV